MCDCGLGNDYEGTWGTCKICGTLIYTPRGKDPENPCAHVKEALD